MDDFQVFGLLGLILSKRRLGFEGRKLWTQFLTCLSQPTVDFFNKPLDKQYADQKSNPSKGIFRNTYYTGAN